MTDIVERLRSVATRPGFNVPICGEAADEIERLRAENERLREELNGYKADYR